MAVKVQFSISIFQQKLKLVCKHSKVVIFFIQSVCKSLEKKKLCVEPSVLVLVSGV